MNMTITMFVTGGFGEVSVENTTKLLSANVHDKQFTSVLTITGVLSDLKLVLRGLQFRFRDNNRHATIRITTTDSNGQRDFDTANVTVDCGSVSGLLITEISFTVAPLRLWLYFSQSIVLKSSFPNDIFLNTSLLLGQNPVISLQNNQIISIYLGQNSMVQLGDILTINTSNTLGCGALVNESVVVPFPANPIGPVFQLQGPTQVGSCSGEVTFYAFVASGGLGRDVAFEWSTNLTSFSRTSDLTILVPESREPGTYYLAVRVTNFLNLSSLRSLLITIVDAPTISLYIDSGDTFRYSLPLEFVPQVAGLPECTAWADLMFDWTLHPHTNGTQGFANLFTIPARTLSFEDTYTLSIIVKDSTDPDISGQANFQFKLLPQPLEVQVNLLSYFSLQSTRTDCRSTIPNSEFG